MKMNPLFGKRIEIERRTWAETYLMMAVITAQRSDDAETKVGCILTDADNTLLSSGFNGYIRGLDSNCISNTRPMKYPWMQHSEKNALLNCARQGKSTLNGIAYITGKPCFRCMQDLLQAGINKIYITDYSKIASAQEYKEEYEALENLMFYSYELFEIPFQDLKAKYLPVLLDNIP